MAYVRISPDALGAWIWCSSCNRVYKTERWAAHHWFCPGEGCNGSLLHAKDFARHYSLKPAEYCAAGLGPLGASPVEGMYFPLWLSPENIAHAGQHGQWIYNQGVGDFVIEAPPVPITPSKVVPGPGYVEPRYQWAWVGSGHARQVMAVVGAEYVIRPLNPKRKRHQDRHCTICAFEWHSKTQAWQALVQFEDGSRDCVDIHDLWADGLSWDLSPDATEG